jgi:YfiH family protein
MHVGDEATAVAYNRTALEARLGAPIVWMRQVHGGDVTVIREVTTEPVHDVDALVTDQPDVGIAVLVADCVPVLMADTQTGVLGVAHVGRRGLVAETAVNAATTMMELGADPGRIQAWLGPSICGRCYEVPVQLRAEVDLAAPGSSSTTYAGKPSIDIRAGLRRQLLGAGVRFVRDVGPCTNENSDYYSYRRDGVTGRTAGVVVLSTRQRS